MDSIKIKLTEKYSKGGSTPLTNCNLLKEILTGTGQLEIYKNTNVNADKNRCEHLRNENIITDIKGKRIDFRSYRKSYNLIVKKTLEILEENIKYLVNNNHEKQIEETTIMATELSLDQLLKLGASLPKIQEGEEFNNYCRRFDLYCDTFLPTFDNDKNKNQVKVDQTKIKLLGQALASNVLWAKVYQTINGKEFVKNEEIKDGAPPYVFKEFTTKFREAIGAKIPLRLIRQQLGQIRQKDYDNPTLHFHAFLECKSKAGLSIAEASSKSWISDCLEIYIDGLTSQNHKDILRADANINNIEKAYAQIMKMSTQAPVESQSERQDKADFNQQEASLPSQTNNYNNSRGRSTWRRRGNSNFRGNRSSGSRGRGYRGRGFGFYRNQVTCLLCKKQGHIVDNCPINPRNNRRANRRNNNYDQENRTFGCSCIRKSNLTHKKRKCKLMYKIFRVNNPFRRGRGTLWRFLIDSGSDSTIISAEMANQLNLEIKKTNIRLTNFAGFNSKCLGTAIIKIETKGATIKIEALVLKNINKAILGLDSITKFGGGQIKTSILKDGSQVNKFEFNCAANSTKSNDSSESAKVEDTTNEDKIQAIARERVVLKPHEIKYVPIKQDELANNKSYIFNSFRKSQELTACHANLFYDNRKPTKIPMINRTTRIKVVQVNQVLGNFEEAEKYEEYSNANNFTGEEKNGAVYSKSQWKKINELIEQKIGHIKEPQFKQAVKRILEQNVEYIDFDLEGLKVKKFNRKVRLNPNDDEIRNKILPQKRRTINPNLEREVQEELDELENQDIIGKLMYPTVPPANLVLAKKKNSSKLRICCDYKNLNSVLPSHWQPMPDQRSLLNKLGFFKQRVIWSSIDCTKCFWQFQIDERDRDLTSFYGIDNVYFWKRMPFGLKSAPGICQDNLQRALLKKGEFSKNSRQCLYIDDVLLTNLKSETKQAIDDLNEMFTNIRNANITINFKKSKFLQEKQIEFMGVVLKSTSSGIKMKVDEKNVRDLQKMEIPNSYTRLRSFIGLCNYLGNNVPNLQQVMGPLNTIQGIERKRGTPKLPFKKVWLQEHTDCFNEIKKLVCQPKILSLPDFSEKFYLEVDSSSTGHGAVLFQKGRNNELRLIGFGSKALDPYSCTLDNNSREVKGIIWAVEKFQQYINGSPHEVEVQTDNRVGAFLRSSTSPKLRRWKAIIDSFNIKLNYKKGENMLISDALSRLILQGHESNRKLKEEKSLDEKLSSERIVCNNERDQQKDDNQKNDTSRNKNESTIKCCEKIIAGYQIHQDYGHAAPNRLKQVYPELTAEQAQLITNRCKQCWRKKAVTTIKQITGTLPNEKEKNHRWYIDFVFTDQKSPYLSILDTSTRYFMIQKVFKKTHECVINALRRVIALTGAPKIIVSDREFNSILGSKNSLAKFLLENNIEQQCVPRHSPFTILVERYHKELKKISTVSDCSFEKAALILNNLPFTNRPRGLNWRNITPNSLYHYNDKVAIKILGSYLEMKSKERASRKMELRGKNLELYQRIYDVGDVVKFNSNQKAQSLVGEVIEVLTKKGKGKFYKVKRFGGNEEMYHLHAEELQKIKAPKEFVKFMLKI